MSDIDLKSRYDIGWFSAYDTLKGMVVLYGFSKVLEALMEIGNLTPDAADLGGTSASNMPSPNERDTGEGWGPTGNHPSR